MWGVERRRIALCRHVWCGARVRARVSPRPIRLVNGLVLFRCSEKYGLEKYGRFSIVRVRVTTHGSRANYSLKYLDVECGQKKRQLQSVE